VKSLGRYPDGDLDIYKDLDISDIYLDIHEYLDISGWQRLEGKFAQANETFTNRRALMILSRN
jgi:hypothetical protein